MTASAVGSQVDDPVAEFYEQHPYPPPVDDDEAFAAGARSADGGLVEHHRVWPGRAPETVTSVLVAGCGTAQAVRHALRRPAAQVVGIDVSEVAVEHTRDLATRHGVHNLELHCLPLEQVDRLDRRFDHVTCTGVLHHLADPDAGLAALRQVLAPGGAVTLMVYATYGRSGVYMLQEYCRRLAVRPSPAELAQLLATLREIPLGHPLSPLLRETRDFRHHDALADALLHPRDRSYTVPELLELVDAAGLRFGRWLHQAPYLPDCGSMSRTPHAERIAALPPSEQFAAMELFRGTITRHTVIAYDQADLTSGDLDFTAGRSTAWRPIPTPTATVVQDRLPAGVAAALLNRAHVSTDVVLFVSAAELEIFRRLDGEVTIGDLGTAVIPLVERLFRHDLVVIDSSGR